jgi:DNA-binding transcriptional ArsR family regulator
MSEAIEHAALRALAEPRRRRILEALAAEPRPVGELARDCGCSRGLMAHHLDVLQDAGLVRVEQRRARVAPDGLAALRRYFDEALTAAAIASPRA